MKVSNRPIIHVRLYREMISQGFDYITLSERAGVGARTLYAIVHGENIPRIDTALRIATTLKKPLDYFYPIEEQRKTPVC